MEIDGKSEKRTGPAAARGFDFLFKYVAIARERMRAREWCLAFDKVFSYFDVEKSCLCGRSQNLQISVYPRYFNDFCINHITKIYFLPDQQNDIFKITYWNFSCATSALIVYEISPRNLRTQETSVLWFLISLIFIRISDVDESAFLGLL